MKQTMGERLAHAWNAFRGKDRQFYPTEGHISSSKPDRVRFSLGNERSIISAIYNRIAIDASSIVIRHVDLDDNNNFLSIRKSSLNECFSLDANKDQTGRGFFQDVVMSLCDEGVVAIVPVESSLDPTKSNSYDIHSLRTGKILEWYPDHVRVRLYNEQTGLKEDLILPKKMVAIIENPLYAVMNEPNSVAKRLIHKLNLLDIVDEQSSSGKLDLIIQLPYIIKSEARKEQAEKRRKDIEVQLSGSKYGIAYTDGTEKVTQLNRPAENNLMSSIEYLTSMLFSQLGMTQAIFDGTADELVMNNYFNRTIEPILAAISDELKRKFLTKTARSQGQSIMYFRDPFKLVPISGLADLADKFTRNEILSSNEFRAIIGYKPHNTKEANELRNKNLNQKDAGVDEPPESDEREDI